MSASLYDTPEERYIASAWLCIITDQTPERKLWRRNYDRILHKTEKHKARYRVLTGSAKAIEYKRKKESRHEKTPGRKAYKKASKEIYKIRIASTGKTYKQLFSELKNKYEQEIKERNRL